MAARHNAAPPPTPWFLKSGQAIAHPKSPCVCYRLSEPDSGVPPLGSFASPPPSRGAAQPLIRPAPVLDRKSTRLNSSHVAISYAVFCLKKKKYKQQSIHCTRY